MNKHKVRYLFIGVMFNFLVNGAQISEMEQQQANQQQSEEIIEDIKLFLENNRFRDAHPLIHGFNSQHISMEKRRELLDLLIKKQRESEIFYLVVSKKIPCSGCHLKAILGWKNRIKGDQLMRDILDRHQESESFKMSIETCYYGENSLDQAGQERLWALSSYHGILE